MNRNWIAGGIRRRLRKISDLFRPLNKKSAMVSSQTLADEVFLSFFNIGKTQEYLSHGDVVRARSALLDHYQNRTDPSWPYPSGTLTDLRLDIGRLSQDVLIEKADQLIDMQVSPDGKKPEIDSDGNIAWAKNLTTTPEWLWRLNRHGWWPILGLAYDVTGDERYTKSFEKQMRHWIRVCPPTPKKNERSYHWRLMETAMRMRVSWIPSFAIFLKSKHFSSEARMEMLRSIYDHAKFLSLFKTELNHLLREINGLVSVSVYFPEFREAKEWLNIALNRLDGEINVQINQDGSHVEVSTGYQWLVLDELEATFDLLRDHSSSPILRPLETVLKKMYELLVHVIRPDGTFPEINDGFLRWTHHRMVQAADKFKRSDFLFVGSGGAKGVAPERCSSAFENAGWYVMRSDWSPEARYLFFDAGPHGGYHGHEDKLSIEVYAFGQSFIVDTGSYTYAKEDPYRAYFVGSQGHNTVLVDGFSQIRRWMDEPQNDQKKPGPPASWVSNETCDYVFSSYAGGYAEFDIMKPSKGRVIKDVKHTRHVLFVKPDYWVVVDEIKATQSHSYDILFHAPPGVEVKEETKKQVVLKTSDDGPGLRIIPEDYRSLDVSWLAGAEAPIQGWISLDHLEKTPSNVVIYHCDNHKSVVFATVLFPYPGGENAEKVTLTSLSVHGCDGKALQIAKNDLIDYFMFSQNSGLKRFGDYETSGNLCLVRTNRQDQVLERFDWGR